MNEKTSRFIDLSESGDWVPFGPPEDAVGQVRWIHEGDENATSVGVWRVEPTEIPPGFQVTSDHDETIHVLEGRGTLEVDGVGTIGLREGVVAFLPAGAVTRWTITAPLREVFVYSQPTTTP